MSILISGGSGLLGIHLAKALCEFGKRVVCVDVKPLPAYAGHIFGSVAGAITFVQGDVLDLEWLSALAETHDIEGIVHAAAVVNEQIFRADPVRGFKTNMLGTLNILEIARKRKLRRVVYTSSATVYGPRESATPIAEELPSPKSLYAESKYIGECLLERYRSVYTVNAVVVRVSTAYGPGKPWMPERYPLQRLLWEAMCGKCYRMDEGADYFRDFTFISDTAQGVCLAYLAPAPKYSVYNIAAGARYSLAEVAKTLNDLFPRSCIEVGGGRFDKDYALAGSVRGPLDISRARQDLDFLPSVDLRQGLQTYAKFLQQYPPE